MTDGNVSLNSSELRRPPNNNVTNVSFSQRCPLWPSRFYRAELSIVIDHSLVIGYRVYQTPRARRVE